MAIAILMVLVILGLLAIISRGNRAHSIVRLSAGIAEQTRGDLPGALLGDLQDVAKRHRSADGRVEIRGEGAALTVTIQGLDGKTAQRVRNVVMMFRKQIRRPR
jgi:hypothetical protein